MTDQSCSLSLGESCGHCHRCTDPAQDRVTTTPEDAAKFERMHGEVYEPDSAYWGGP